MKTLNNGLTSSDLDMVYAQLQQVREIAEHSTKHGKDTGALTATPVAPAMAKPVLPKGSVTFQEVLEEIRKEKEAEKALAEKAVEVVQQQNRPRQRLESTSENTDKTNRWRLAKMKFFQRTKSQRELLLK